MGFKLEVFRMSLYLTFPVVMFWISNQAEWFEDYVVQRKRELWPREKEDQDEAGPTYMVTVIGMGSRCGHGNSEAKERRQELEEFKQRIRKQREERLLQAAQQSS